jgi:hypothetical protein
MFKLTCRQPNGHENAFLTRKMKDVFLGRYSTKHK